MIDPSFLSARQADIPDLSRVTYFDGERLAATDLNEAATVQREFRWLHNRSLHNWGIALGFAVQGAKGDRQVTISPGYALDCQGREIILTETITKAVPARSGDTQGQPLIYYLVAAYPDDSRLTVLEQRQGECDSDGAVRLQERAAIYWKGQGDGAVEGGMEIVLAQAKVQNCVLAAALSTEQRRAARPSQQPLVAAGQTPAGSTPWEAWTITVDNESRIIGVRVTVDTTEARFGSAPSYQARLAGDRVINQINDGQPFTFVLDGTPLVSDPARQRFTFAMLLPRELQTGGLALNPDSLFNNAAADLLDTVKTHWSVVWVGVEG
jgi:hypothetical protein